MPDMNPFAMGYGAQQPATGAPGAAPASVKTANPNDNLPDYLKQQPNPTIPGAANNMIRALMAGASQQPAGAPNANPVAGGSPASQWPSATAPGAAGAGVPYAGASPWGVAPSPQDQAMINLMVPPPA